MNRTLPAALAMVLAFALEPEALRGQAVQSFVGGGGGMVSPTGTLGAEANVGWHLFATGGRTLKGSLGVTIDALYGRMTHKNGVPGKTALGGSTANLALFLSGRSIWPFVTAGLGAYAVTIQVPGFGSARSTKLALGGGVGVLIGSGPRRGFVTARYISVATSPQSTKFLPVSAGLVLSTGRGP